MAARKHYREPVAYALERLFVDQERDLVHDTIAAVLAWVPGKGNTKRAQPFRFEVEHVLPGKRSVVPIELSWDVHSLESAVPGLRDHVRRLTTSRSAQREHIAELAAYGLTFVGISGHLSMTFWPNLVSASPILAEASKLQSVPMGSFPLLMSLLHLAR